MIEVVKARFAAMAIVLKGFEPLFQGCSALLAAIYWSIIPFNLQMIYAWRPLESKKDINEIVAILAEHFLLDIQQGALQDPNTVGAGPSLETISLSLSLALGF